MRPLPQQFLRHLREDEVAEALTEDPWIFFLGNCHLSLREMGVGLGYFQSVSLSYRYADIHVMYVYLYVYTRVDKHVGYEMVS